MRVLIGVPMLSGAVRGGAEWRFVDLELGRRSAEWGPVLRKKGPCRSDVPRRSSLRNPASLGDIGGGCGGFGNA
jgi:hypothetical protein